MIVYVKVIRETQRRLLYDSIKDFCYNDINHNAGIEDSLLASPIEYRRGYFKLYKFTTEPLEYRGRYGYNVKESLEGIETISVNTFLQLIEPNTGEIRL